MLNGRINNFPNHSIRNGEVYKSGMHERKLIPDSDGLYTIKYMGDVRKLSFKELTGGVVAQKTASRCERTVVNKNSFYNPKKPKINPIDIIGAENYDEVRIMCKRIYTNIGSYSNWLNENKINPKCIDDHRKSIIRRRKETINKPIDIVLMCFESGINVQTYIRTLRRKGLRSCSMSKKSHQEQIKLLKRLKSNKKQGIRYE